MEPSVLLTLDGGWGRLVSIFCFRQNAVAFFCEEASGRARREIKHCAHSFCCSRFCCAAARRGGLFGLVAPVFMELRAFGPPPVCSERPCLLANEKSRGFSEKYYAVSYDFPLTSTHLRCKKWLSSGRNDWNWMSAFVFPRLRTRVRIRT